MVRHLNQKSLPNRGGVRTTSHFSPVLVVRPTDAESVVGRAGQLKKPRLLWSLACLLSCCSAAKADPPSIAGLFPAGGAPGSEFVVEASGKNETWPASIWTNSEGLAFEPVADKKGQWTARISADCAPGVYLLRAYHEAGASPVRQFVVADPKDGAELREKEPNQHYKEAQSVTPFGEVLAVVVNGTLDPREDVDCFAVDLKKGQWLVAEASAYRLDAPADPLLHVRDENGTRLAFNHDKEGPALDPRLAFEAPESGTYTVEFAGFVYPPKNDIRFTGNREAVYRLRLSVAPEVLSVFPTGMRMGETHRVELIGWNLPQLQVTVSCDGDLPLVVTNGPEFVEDPGDGFQRLGSPPVYLSGRIEAPGDIDTFTLVAKKGERLSIRVRTWEIGSMLDSVLRILSPEGKELAKADDVSALRPESKLEWTAPNDGDFKIEVRSRFPGEGAPDQIYRLEVTPLTPSLLVTVSQDLFEVPRGGELELKVATNRQHGYTEAGKLSAVGLPPGVTSAPVEIPEKGGEVTLKLAATKEAASAKGPFRIVSGDGTIAKFALKGSYAEPGDLFVNEVQDFWLTVTPPKEEEKAN
jgi:hypothetical protein